jgi:serine/threonine-protein kinase RsbW
MLTDRAVSETGSPGEPVDEAARLAERTGAWIEVCLSRSEEVVPVLEMVLAAMAECGFSGREQRDLRLALEEAVVNGLKHGNAGDPSKQVRLRYWVSSREALAEVQDDGPGFDPEAVPDPTELQNLDRPSGRGLLLIRHYTTWVRYHGSGNHVTLCKQRSATPLPAVQDKPAQRIV